MNHILAELKERAPVYQKLSEDYEVAKTDISRLNEELRSNKEDKQRAFDALREAKEVVKALEAENRALKQDTKDLARQVQVLLRELETSGMSDVDPSVRALEFATLERINQNIDETLGGETEADGVISERLVVFKSIQELQSQNQNMRRMLRNMAKQVEDLQAEKDRTDNERVQKEVQGVKVLIDDLKEQVKVQALKCETYLRERDQWKRIAESRGTVTPGQSTVPSPSRVADPEDTKYRDMYIQVQTDYDAFRKEVGVDSRMLKDQIDSLKHEKNDLALQVAKLNTQLGYQNGMFQI